MTEPTCPNLEIQDTSHHAGKDPNITSPHIRHIFRISCTGDICLFNFNFNFICGVVMSAVHLAYIQRAGGIFYK
jgi:hypothetical protein